MTSPVDLPALREAVARLQSVQCTPEIDPGVRGWIEDGKVVADALPALLDELERERIENAHLRQAFVTMERAYNAAVAT